LEIRGKNKKNPPHWCLGFFLKGGGEKNNFYLKEICHGGGYFGAKKGRKGGIFRDGEKKGGGCRKNKRDKGVKYWRTKIIGREGAGY